MNDNVRFTVVIPTRDRLRSLARCLNALELQRVDGEFEVIVVDDGSRETEEVDAIVAASSRARLIHTAPSGSAPARNRGVREARAPVVLFLDDDCEASPGWAAALSSAVSKRGEPAAGPALNPEPRNALAAATQIVLDHLTEWARSADGLTAFAPTYNLGCPRDVVLTLPFEESYVNSGADRDWCSRLHAAGRSIVVEPDAVVAHRQVTNIGDFVRKHFRYGRGSSRFRHIRHERLLPPSFYVGLIREGFALGLRPGVFVCLAQLATAAGYAAEKLARRRTRAALGTRH